MSLLTLFHMASLLWTVYVYIQQRQRPVKASDIFLINVVSEFE